jgi:hypothetical protein
MEEVRISGPLNHRRYSAGKRQLDREAPLQNLERVEAKAVQPTEPAARVAADITLHWSGEGDEPGEELPIDGLNEGESVLIAPGVRIKLEKRRGGKLAWWLVLLIVLALALWASAFVYLCFIP